MQNIFPVNDVCALFLGLLLYVSSLFTSYLFHFNKYTMSQLHYMYYCIKNTKKKVEKSIALNIAQPKLFVLFCGLHDVGFMNCNSMKINHFLCVFMGFIFFFVLPFLFTTLYKRKETETNKYKVFMSSLLVNKYKCAIIII